ncbi:thymidylate synthase [Clostridia bacterium]|nr:thymidylate synthase [Clostridia bacterium]
MRETGASVTIIDDVNGENILRHIEQAGRTCYKSNTSEDESDSHLRFVRMIIKNGHESVLEHEKVSVRIICDRGVTHEIVRHRLGSYSQESTRYCNYTHDKFGSEITCITPTFWKDKAELMGAWRNAMEQAEQVYNDMISQGATPEQARSVLPNSLKTEIVVTYNLREWRHFLKLRTAKAAHPQMREVALLCLESLRSKIPVIFEDI